MLKLLKNCLLLMCLSVSTAVTAEDYLSQSDFIARYFNQTPSLNTLWLTEEHKSKLGQIFERPYKQFRIKYWQLDARLGFIFEEIGKEKPITIGIVVENQKIVSVEILAFRESRGWEIKYPSFTNQFQQVGLTSDSRLDKHIDGISGATLSVNAVTRSSLAALYLTPYLIAQGK